MTGGDKEETGGDKEETDAGRREALNASIDKKPEKEEKETKGDRGDKRRQKETHTCLFSIMHTYKDLFYVI